MIQFKKIYLEITNSCNLNCDFCIKNSRKIDFLTKDKFIKLLDKVKPYTNYLYFHLLGEPLLHPQINEFIYYASKNFHINITTNGYLINKIKDNNNIRQLNISLHSFDLKYQKTLEKYMDDILNVSDILSKKGTYISFRFWVNNKYSDKMLEMINKHFNTNINLLGNNSNITIKENIFISIFHPFIWPDLNNEKISDKGTCYALKDHIGILVDGTVVPCCLDTKGDINLGNIYENNLEKIMFNEKAQKMLEGFKKGEKYEELCRKCNFLD